MAEKDTDREKSGPASSSSGLVVSDQEQDLAQTALAGIYYFDLISSSFVDMLLQK